MSDYTDVQAEGGKYTFRSYSHGRVDVLRYGEVWHAEAAPQKALIALIHETAAKDARIERLQKALAFYACVIKCGEPWSALCQSEYDATITGETK